jgi:hypothetical protein
MFDMGGGLYARPPTPVKRGTEPLFVLRVRVIATLGEQHITATVGYGKFRGHARRSFRVT